MKTRYFGIGAALALTLLLLGAVAASVTLAQRPEGQGLDWQAELTSKEVTADDIQVTKAVSPTAVLAGRDVTYTVTFRNQGNAAGTMDAITDTLPAGFAFVGMAPGSGISQPPKVTGSTLGWTGPFSMPVGATLHLVYRVRTALVGAWRHRPTG